MPGGTRAAPVDLDCWTFLPAPSPLAFWACRQAHETVIHRADADAAMDAVPAYDAAFAADGIAELLDGFYGRRGGSLVGYRANGRRSRAIRRARALARARTDQVAVTGSRNESLVTP